MEKEKRHMKRNRNARTVDTVRERERERESNLEKLSFICCAQNKIEIKNRYESINKTDYFEILKLILMNQLILHDSLFY